MNNTDLLPINVQSTLKVYCKSYCEYFYNISGSISLCTLESILLISLQYFMQQLFRHFWDMLLIKLAYKLT
jgi:hypothetical protein